MTSFAVVELFTSEGCSSCPPADDVLAELAARRERGDPVFTLGFHVDYWDDLGWPEPFGASAWTQRQRAYAAALRTRGLYTPQAVVNGVTDLVGSQRRRMHKAVDAALRTRGLEITANARIDNGTVEITAAMDATAPPGTILTAVLTQRRGHSEVTRGENAGHTLHHVDIVRALGVMTLAGILRLGAPDGGPGGFSVTVLAQDPNTLHVRGATRASADQPAAGSANSSGTALPAS